MTLEMRLSGDDEKNKASATRKTVVQVSCVRYKVGYM